MLWIRRSLYVWLMFSSITSNKSYRNLALKVHSTRAQRHS